MMIGAILNTIFPPQRARPRVISASDLKQFELKLHAKTGTGILVSDGRHGHKPQWLSLPQCRIEDTGRVERIWNDDHLSSAPVIKVTVSKWFAREKGLI
jgi:hypothetical protein